MAANKRLIVGISGATGIAYAVRLLQSLREANVETHVVVSRAGDLTRAHEVGLSARQLRELGSVHYRNSDLGAPVASGSFRTLGMVVIPCSVKSLAEIATGVSSTLLSRAADVTLKERRKLVLVVRETPLSLIHLRNMVAVTEAGGVILPPVPAFYTFPKTVDDLIKQTADRVLDQFDIPADAVRWGEDVSLFSKPPAAGGRGGGDTGGRPPG